MHQSFLFMLRLVQLSRLFREYYEAKPPRLHSNENNIALTCPIKWLAGNNEVNTYILLNVLVYSITEYRNFRSFTRTADYPHRPIIAYGEKKVNRLPALVDNPHVVIQLFGGENVTLR